MNIDQLVEKKQFYLTRIATRNHALSTIRETITHANNKDHRLASDLDFQIRNKQYDN